MPPSYSKCMASILSFLAIESKFVILYVNSPESFTVQDFFISVQEIRRHDFEQKKKKICCFEIFSIKNDEWISKTAQQKFKGLQRPWWEEKKEHEGERSAVWTLHKPKALIRTSDPPPPPKSHPTPPTLEKKWWIFPPLYTWPPLCSAVDQIFIVKPWQYFPSLKKSLFRAWALGGKTLYLETFFFLTTLHKLPSSFNLPFQPTSCALTTTESNWSPVDICGFCPWYK